MSARSLSIGPLTALGLSPPRLMEAAAAAGVQGVGIRMLPSAPGGVCYRLMDDPALLRETLAAKAANGMRIVDLEMVRIGVAFDAAAFMAFFETGARLGAAHILVAVDDPDEARATASFAALCEAMRPWGLTAELEFMPWTEACDLGAAKRIVMGAAQPNGGILVDALHFARSNSRLADLDDIPRAALRYAQLCDGPAQGPTSVDGLIHAARCERLLPGEGDLDLAGLLRRLPAGLPICIETPSDSRTARLGFREWVRQSAVATQRWLEAIDLE